MQLSRPFCNYTTAFSGVQTSEQQIRELHSCNTALSFKLIHYLWTCLTWFRYLFAIFLSSEY